MAVPQTATGVIQVGQSFYVLGIKDANGNYAQAYTPFYQTPAGLIVPAPVDASGNPQVSLAGSSATYAGTLATSTTAAALGASQLCSEILVQSDPSNTTNVKVGNATAQTVVISPGASLSVSVNNVADLYAVAVSGTPQINWLARS